MSLSLTRSLVTALAIASLAFVGAPASAGGNAPTPISSARHQAVGSSVTVRGTVTVPSGAFDAGFAVQQGNSGIYVLDAGGAARKVGDVVTITGTLVDNFGLLSIQPSAVPLVRKGEPIEAREASTASVGEGTEGRLLHLEGTMVGPLVDDSPYGYKLEIDDGSGPVQIFLYPGTGISTQGLAPGAEIELDCFSSQFDTHYECDPPTAGDFHVE